MQIILFLQAILVEVVRIPIILSDITCAGNNTHCEFFNKDTKRILQTTIYNNPRIDLINRVINGGYYPDFLSETIYDNTPPDRAAKRRIDGFLSRYTNFVLGHAYYEISKGAHNQFTNIKVFGGKSSIYSKAEDSLKLLFLKDFTDKKLKRQLLINEVNQEQMNNFSDLLIRDNHSQVSNRRVKICVKCVLALHRYEKITHFLSGTRLKPRTNIYLNCGGAGLSEALYIFDKNTNSSLIVRRVRLPIAIPLQLHPFLPANVAAFVNQPNFYFVGYYGGRLVLFHPSGDRFLPLRTYNFEFLPFFIPGTPINLRLFVGPPAGGPPTPPMRFVITSEEVPLTSIPDGSFKEEFRKALAKLKDMKKDKNMNEDSPEFMEVKQLKLVQRLDDSDECEDIEPGIEKVEKRIRLVLTPEECDGIKYCCLYNCNFDRVRNIVFYTREVGNVLREYESLLAQGKTIDYSRYKGKFFGDVVNQYIVDKKLIHTVKKDNYVYGKDPTLDFKILNYANYEASGFSCKSICIKCLKVNAMLEEIVQLRNMFNIKAILKLDTYGDNKIPVKAIVSRNGNAIVIRRFKIENWEKILSWGVPGFSNFIFQKLLITRPAATIIQSAGNLIKKIIPSSFVDRQFDYFFVGFYGDEFCAISKDFKTTVPLYLFDLDYVKLVVEQLVFEKDKSKAQKAMSSVGGKYFSLPKFILNDVTNAPNPTAIVFNNVSTLPHSHPFNYRQL